MSGSQIESITRESRLTGSEQFAFLNESRGSIYRVGEHEREINVTLPHLTEVNGQWVVHVHLADIVNFGHVNTNGHTDRFASSEKWSVYERWIWFSFQLETRLITCYLNSTLLL